MLAGSRPSSVPSRTARKAAGVRLTAGALLLLAPCALASEPPPTGAGDARSHAPVDPVPRAPGEDRLDALVRPSIDSGATVGLVVGILDHDERTIRGYGRVSPADPAAPDGSTVYDIASLTKGLTMVMAHHAARSGEIGLGDTLDEHLPDGITAPRKDGQPILIRHLVEHRSGLPRDYVPRGRRDLEDPFSGYPLDVLYEGLGVVELRFRPGTDLAYSNYGYALLGQVLKRAADRTYDELLEERVTGPLGMTDTRQRLTDSMRTRLAPGYDAKRRARPRGHLGALEGAAGVCSTARDLLRFARAVNSPPAGETGAAIASAFLAMAAPPSRDRPARRWSDLPDGLRTGAEGRSFGYRSTLILYPNRKWALVLLANSDSRELDGLAWRIADALGPNEPVPGRP